MWCSISSGQGSGRTARSSAFRKYLIVAFSIPLGIVVLSLALGETNALNVGYGKNLHYHVRNTIG